MYAVIFEVHPNANGQEEYLAIAASLREKLQHVEGFISIERFQSLVDEGKLLSLSFWESENAIKQWREDIEHHHAQQQGRNRLFNDYRIRVAKVERDYSLNSREQAPKA